MDSIERRAHLAQQILDAIRARAQDISLEVQRRRKRRMILKHAQFPAPTIRSGANIIKGPQQLPQVSQSVVKAIEGRTRPIMHPKDRSYGNITEREQTTAAKSTASEMRRMTPKQLKYKR